MKKSNKINKKYDVVKRYGRVLAGVLSCCVILSGCENAGGSNDIMWQLEESQTSEEVVSGSEAAESQEITQETETQAATIYVYVCGAVNVPGVYEVPEASRLFEVISLAGGMTAEADETYQNLARIVSDGEQIRILTKEEATGMEQTGMDISSALTTSGCSTTDGLVNINTATESELTTLSGIGNSRAQAIITYRETQGPFRSIEDIQKVDGIKEGLYQKIKDKITVG